MTHATQLAVWVLWAHGGILPLDKWATWDAASDISSQSGESACGLDVTVVDSRDVVASRVRERMPTCVQCRALCDEARVQYDQHAEANPPEREVRIEYITEAAS